MKLPVMIIGIVLFAQALGLPACAQSESSAVSAPLQATLTYCETNITKFEYAVMNDPGFT